MNSMCIKKMALLYIFKYITCIFILLTKYMLDFLIGCYRYWINICQGIHDGPDPQICSERSASCLRTTDGKIHNLGTVTSQTLSMEGLCLQQYCRNNTSQTLYTAML